MIILTAMTDAQLIALIVFAGMLLDLALSMNPGGRRSRNTDEGAGDDGGGWTWHSGDTGAGDGGDGGD